MSLRLAALYNSSNPDPYRMQLPGSFTTENHLRSLPYQVEDPLQLSPPLSRATRTTSKALRLA